ncbi:hypothetical protein QM240_13745, partial [Acinetobacter baumannii]|nr:hypothetical protein [Acinetobacter baumannii]
DRLPGFISTLLKKRIRMQGFIIFDDYGSQYPEFYQQMFEWLKEALLHKDLKVKTSHIYSKLSDNSGMWSA